MYVIRINNTTHGIYKNNKILFVGFKNRNHAITTEAAIRKFVGLNGTLPPMDDSDNIVKYNDTDDWINILYDMKIEEISYYEMHAMCELCNADFLHVTDMMVKNTYDILKLAYSGDMHEGFSMSTDEYRYFLETLV